MRPMCVLCWGQSRKSIFGSFKVHFGPFWGQSGVETRSSLGRSEVDSGSICGQYGIDIRSITLRVSNQCPHAPMRRAWRSPRVMAPNCRNRRVTAETKRASPPTSLTTQVKAGACTWLDRCTRPSCCTASSCHGPASPHLPTHMWIHNWLYT